MLTDADVTSWREVKSREWNKVPSEYHHLTIFGVADRNVECWLSINRQVLAGELGCQVNEIPDEDPSGFIKRRLGYGQRGVDKQAIKERVRDFVAGAPLRSWIEGSDSFEDFYQGARRLAQQTECVIPNELERT